VTWSLFRRCWSWGPISHARSPGVWLLFYPPEIDNPGGGGGVSVGRYRASCGWLLCVDMCSLWRHETCSCKHTPLLCLLPALYFEKGHAWVVALSQGFYTQALCINHGIDFVSLSLTYCRKAMRIPRPISPQFCKHRCRFSVSRIQEPVLTTIFPTHRPCYLTWHRIWISATKAVELRNIREYLYKARCKRENKTDKL
jgi:hypothetical protein